MKDEQDWARCTLARFLPAIKGKVAWFDMGADYPSKIAALEAEDPESGRRFRINLKREDRVATKSYAGNKVRSLEFSLACAAVLCEERDAKVVTIGGPGSNQIVATSVYAATKGVPCEQFPSFPEDASLDNVLNVFSMISLPGWRGAQWAKGPGSKLPLLANILRQARSKVVLMMPGANNNVGCLGQVGGALELCEQVDQGEVAAPKHIFLPVGSSCTITGLLVGIAMSRKLGMKGLSGDIKVHGVIIHHAFALLPFAVRFLIGFVARDTLRTIIALGGPDASSDLEQVLSEGLVLHTNYAGRYGGWTPEALKAKSVAQHATFSDGTPIWACSTFTGKCFAAILDFVRDHDGNLGDNEVLLWCTKSLVQPLGPAKSVQDICQGVADMPQAGKSWLLDGCGDTSERRIKELLVDKCQEVDLENLLEQLVLQPAN
ncbi:L-cysteate sulfo-lyase, partial [Durusdinium trenchii]